MVRRHEVLRTVYRSREGRPVQRVLEPAEVSAGSLPRVDLAALGESRARLLAVELAERLVRRPFALESVPPLRACLWRIAAQEHLLALVVHHIAFDGESARILSRELSVLYRAALHGHSPVLAPLPIQYADYALWQRQVLAGDWVGRALDHWRRRLEGLEGLELPADRPRPAVRTSRGGGARRTLSRCSAEAVGRRARELGVTRFMIWAAGFAALLHRLAGRRDVVFGAPAGQRRPSVLDPLVGCFVNPLVLRVDASGDPTFGELAARLRALVLADHPHAALPFERLVEELVPKRDLARTPLFQVLFAVSDPEAGALALDGLEVSRRAVSLRTAKHDLALEVADGAPGPVLAATYSADLFDGVTVARLLAGFEALMADALAEPATRISQLALLAPGPRHQLLAEWNDTLRPVPAGPVHQGFEVEARRRPDAIAVRAGDGELTYRELDDRASRLAHRLRRLGAGPESTVAVALDRRTELLVGLLGILKTGAAYVPLDPDYPSARLALVLDDSGAALLVTSDELWRRLPRAAARRVPIDDLGREPAVSPGPPVGSLGLAYSIYTSGSSGRPKGVQVTHRSVANLVHDVAARVGLNAGKRLLAVTPISFDISVFELLGTLAAGGTVVLARRGESADGRALAAVLAASQADLMQATPVTWRLLVAAGWEGRPGFTALCAGEALPADLAQAIVSRGARLWNLYGPTETTVYSTAAAIDGSGPVTIGRPIANTRVYAVEGGARAAPAGVPGEVCIGGVGLARGYLGRPALTAERFVPDALSGLPGERLYRTGDLAAVDAAGRLRYLGRLDHQVKLRGFRIELGEVETALAEHPAVTAVAAAVRPGAGGEPRLVAWYTGGEQPTDELTAFLGERLPAYMVPAAFVHLSGFPQTPNHKVDRKALPEPAAVRPRLAVRYLAPSNGAERSVAAVWRQVLGIDEVGLDDSFFDLGGNSLLAVQVLERLPAAGLRQPSLVDLFRFPTVRSLAGWLTGQEADRSPAPALLERARLRRQSHRARRRGA